MIENINEFGNVSEKEVEAFQEINGIELPLDYKNFLLESNGGKPNPNNISNPDTVVTYILGMHNGEYYASLYKHIDMFKNRIPLSTFPVATDPFGNLFLMSLHNDSYGHIYFWDHEGEPEFQDGHYVENCSFVAYSFKEFLDKLN